MRDEGLPVKLEWLLYGHFSALASYSATGTELTRTNLHKLNAGVCTDDGTAMGGIHTYPDMGYVVPHGVSVI